MRSKPMKVWSESTITRARESEYRCTGRSTVGLEEEDDEDRNDTDSETQIERHTMLRSDMIQRGRDPVGRDQ